MHAGGRFGTSVARLGCQVCQGQLSLPSFQGRYMSGGGGGGIRLARGKSWALPRALNLGVITVGQGVYYGRTLVTVVTAILKAVSLHTVATELPSTSSDTSMGIKQSSSLTLAMYVPGVSKNVYKVNQV